MSVEGRTKTSDSKVNALCCTCLHRSKEATAATEGKCICAAVLFNHSFAVIVLFGIKAQSQTTTSPTRAAAPN